MVELKKILVCFDFTPLSIKALEWAKVMSKGCGAHLVVFHELEDVYTITKASAGFGFPIAPNLLEEEEKKAVEKLKPLIKELGDAEFIIEAKGKTIDRLPVIADMVKPDLIIASVDCEHAVKNIKVPILLIK